VRGSVGLPDEGIGAHRMKRFDAAASIIVALSLVVLAGCEDAPWHLDPLAINGRDGGGPPANYSTLMRIGAAAHAGGDLATAVSVYRRAAAIEPRAVAPYVAAGNTLIELGQFNEAIVTYHSALAHEAHDPEALRGLARAYLMSAKPELASQSLAVAFKDTPDDPKLLQLIGVADDFVGQHEEAQARYRRGLELLPRDPALTLNLALSLALTGNYPEAVAALRPLATAPTSSPRERQTLALIYGLQGDQRAAEQMARHDLDGASVQHNLAYYDSLRRLSPQARQRAIRSLGMRPTPSRSS
jgi:Flp pilus assembly protein TadD